MARFEADESLVCEFCNDWIYPGSSYIEHEGKAFCHEECLKGYLLDHIEYEEKHLNSSEDYENEFADIQYETAREEALMNGC